MTKFRTHYGSLKISRDAPDFVIRAAWNSVEPDVSPEQKAPAANVPCALC